MKLNEISWFRRALGAYLIYSYALLLPDFLFFYGPHGMVDRTALQPAFPSLLLLHESPAVHWIVVAVLFVLSGALMVGRLGRLGVLTLFLIHVSFHNANPLIIHEPSQILSLFLICLLVFLPLQDTDEFDPFIVRTLVIALGVYYLFAGLKKLPDPLWRSGEALGLLLAWDGLRSPTAVNRVLVSNPAVTRLLDFGTLAFELFFLPLALTRARPWLLVLGITFHLLIASVMNVGTFSAIMLVWYTLLLDEPTRSRFARVFRANSTRRSK
jgi:hypothetical protein